MENRIKKFEGLYDFLSNSYVSTFYYNGVKYKSVSHAYYSLKAKHDSDSNRIRGCKTPKEAIQEARKCETKSDWQDYARDIMRDLLFQKFDNVFLKPKLLETGDILLGDGRNFVGELLMEVRENISKQKEEENNG